MKGSLLTLMFIMVFIGSCNCEVNTTDGQVSKSISESKKNGFFVRQYLVDKRSTYQLNVEEAWIEKTWSNEIRKGQIVKVATDQCQLCFKIKQIPQLKFRTDFYSDWLMKNSKNNTYVGVGIYSGMYNLFIDDCSSQNSISLDLFIRRDTLKIKVGTLVFVPVPATK